MTEFLQTLLTYPTIFFSVMLVLALLYWLMVILGAVDLDALTGADGALDGAAEGLAEGAAEGLAEGAAEGLAEGAAEGLAEGAAEGLAEGAAEGMADAAAEGAAEGMTDAAAEGAAEGAQEASVNIFGMLLGLLNLRGVPITLILSSVTLISWVVSFIATSLLKGVLTTPGLLYGVGSGIAFGSLLVGFVVTSFALRPLKKAFVVHRKIGQQTLIGKTCEVLSSSVTENFGRAEFDDGGGDLLIEVRCDSPNNGLKAGTKALIIDYDPKEHVYHVEPVDAFLGLNNAAELTLEEQITQAAEVKARVP